MRALIVKASAMLTFGILALGYVIEFLFTFISMTLNLSGPHTNAPVAWAWFGASLFIFFAASFAFCSSFAARVAKKSLVDRTFL